MKTGLMEDKSREEETVGRGGGKFCKVPSH